MSDTIKVIGMDLPVIAKLPHGFTLALHKNGPCVCTTTEMMTLVYPLIHGRENQVSSDVFAAAINAYIEYSWPLIKDNK